MIADYDLSIFSKLVRQCIQGQELDSVNWEEALTFCAI